MRRIMLAGTGSGCGKTTASLIVMAVLQQSGFSVAPYKAGPDYIDPGFHRAICGRPSHNLDDFLMDRETIGALLCTDADIGVIEGVMGYYDGLDAETMRCSSWALARETGTPVVLVVDASGGAASVAAQVKGFATLREDSGIAGVLVNRVAGERHYRLVREAVLRYTGLPCVGYLTRQAALDLKSRHLGLVPAEETPDATGRVFAAAKEAQETLDIPLLMALAEQAGEIAPPANRVADIRAPFRLGVARDEAFSFYYEANFDALRRAGMSLVFFSPLRDAMLPEGLDGLYIGGGFPEVFADRLEQNASMRESIRAALSSGMPCYAECGGLLYLSERIDGREMVGFLPVACRMTPRLQRFGYVMVSDRTGLTFPAHEFHHAVAEATGEVRYAYTVQKASDPSRTWRCGFERAHTLAAFAHLHFAAHPELIARLWGKACGGAAPGREP